MDDNTIMLDVGDFSETLFEEVGHEEAVVPGWLAAVDFGEEEGVDGVGYGTVGGEIEVREGGKGG